MKKILFLSMIFLFHMKSYAQTEKGTIFLGGQFNATGFKVTASSETSDVITNYFNFNVAPNVGQFIKDNLAIGLAITIGDENIKTIYNPVNPVIYRTTSKTTTMSYGLGLFMRSYKKITGDFFFSLNGQLNYLSKPGKLEQTTEDPAYVYPATDPAVQYTRANTVGASFIPGLDYFITPHLGLRTTFGNLYFSTSTGKNITLQDGNEMTYLSYGLNLNLNTFTFGMNYFF